MRNLIETITSVSLIGFVYIVFRYIQYEFLDIFNNNVLFSMFYIPAAVRVFSAIIFGYWAAAGIAIGLLIDITYLHPEQLMMHEVIVRVLQTAVGVVLSFLIWAKLSNKVSCLSNPNIDFQNIDAFDILQICLIQAFFNSATAHLFYIWAPSINHQFDLYGYFIMFIGDLTGAFFIFIIANVMFSLLKRTRFFPHKHYDDTMNNQ